MSTLNILGTVAREADIQQPAAQAPGVLETIGAAQSLASPVAMLVRQAERFSYSPDPEFVLDEKTFDRLTQDVDPVYWDMFSSVDSLEEAWAVRNQALDMTQSQQLLQNAGMGGIAARVAAELLDPASLTAMLATGGLAFANTASKASLAVKLGMANAAPQAAIDLYRTTQSPDVTMTDVAAGALGGFGFGVAQGVTRGASLASRVGAGAAFTGAGSTLPYAMDEDTNDAQNLMLTLAMSSVLGGALNALPGPALRNLPPEQRKIIEETMSEIDVAARTDIERAAAVAAAEEGLPLTDRGVASYKAATERLPPELPNPDLMTPDEIRQQLPNVGESVAEDLGTLEVPPRMGVEGPAMGAASAEELRFRSELPETPVAKYGNFNAGQIVLDGKGRLDSFLSGMRSIWEDPAAVVNRAEDAATRWLGKVILSDFDAKKASLSAQLAQAHRGVMQEVSRATRSAFRLAQNEGKYRSLAGGYDQFNVDVSRALRGLDARRASEREIDALPVGVREAVRNYVSTRKALLNDLAAKSPELREAVDGMLQRPFMLHRMANRGAVDAIVRGKDEEAKSALDRLLDAAMMPYMRSIEGESPEKVDAIVKAMREQWKRNAGSHNEGIAFAQGRAFDLDTIDELERIAREQGLSEANVAAFKFALTGKRQAEGTVPALRSRIEMDETASVTYNMTQTQPDGSRAVVGQKTLRLDDLLINDYMTIVDRSSQALLGQMAFNELGRVIQARIGTNEAFTSYKKWEGFLNQNVTDKNAAAQLDMGVRRMLGMALAEDITPRRAAIQASAGVLRDGLQTAYLSNVATGIANTLGELPWAVARNGFRHSMRLFPEFGSLMRAAASGEPPPDGLWRAVMDLGYGANDVLMRPMKVADAGDATLDRAMKARIAARKMANFAFRASLSRASQDMLEMFAAGGALAKMVDFASGKATFSPKDLFELGIDEGDFARIKRGILAGTKQSVAQGLSMNRASLDWQAMRPEDAATIRNAVHVFARRNAQLSDMSQNPLWLQRSWGWRFVMQFRSYGLHSFAAKTIRGARDVAEGRKLQAGLSFLVSTAGAALAHWVNVYSRSQFQEDPEEFRRERLQLDLVALAAVGRSGWASLIPIPIDGILTASGKTPYFSQARTSGLGQEPNFESFLTSMPVTDWAVAAGTGGFRSLRAAISDDYDLTQRDVRNLVRAAMIPNVFYLRDFLVNSIVEDLPRVRPADQRSDQ